MAITKVIAIRSRLDSRVNYVTNSKKTTLAAGLTYITNPEKTEQSFFVTTINCGSPETAYREMQQVKQRFHNTGGVLGYHFIQSFAPGEVTPEQAHKIGVAFAREVFGDAYQVVIGTHLDRAHLHSHIIINSVSFLDGKKYHSSPISYYNTIRKTSDELCKAENLSVLSPEGSMNYLVGMLYTQCFQELYRVADEKYKGKLPIPVRVIQDEWANVAQPDSYPKILATCRSYNISLNIIVQNIAQIKNIYEKEWESIIGNCDTLLFLGGGNEPTSLEFMSKLLGKETLDTRTRGLTRGHSGSSSTNYQQAGRELMMQEEIRLMDTDDSILLIRGERPVLDKKYDLMKHPNIKLTEDGGAAPYVHKSLPTKFEVSDLPYDFRSLDDYQFDTMEEFDHENPDEDEEE